MSPFRISLHILAVTLIFSFTKNSFGDSSVYGTLKLKNGIQVEIPRNWTLFNRYKIDTIQASAEAMLDIAKIAPNHTNSLLHAVFKDGEIYGTCRISTLDCETFTTDSVEFLLNNTQILNEISDKMLADLRKAFAVSNVTIISEEKPKRSLISNEAALCFSYTRSSPTTKSAIVVNQYHFPNPNGTKNILTLSYSKDSELLMRPIIDKIKKSVTKKNLD